MAFFNKVTNKYAMVRYNAVQNATPEGRMRFAAAVSTTLAMVQALAEDVFEVLVDHEERIVRLEQEAKVNR